MTPFESATYLSQVRRLRDMADRAIKCYPIQPAACSLISHWENTTFKITTRSGRRYLLRIHRPGYHGESEILEELSWLERLSVASTLTIPVPVQSRNGRLVESVASPRVPQQRYCCLFKWIDGYFLRRSVGLSHMSKLGGVIAGLHRSSEGLPVIHRRYWDAEGLVGSKPKFGSIDRLEGISTKMQDILSDGRLLILRQLKRFEGTFPQKQGLIHADLHFDNVLMSQRDLAVIDFDDCGFGFHAYDLAVNLGSVRHSLPAGRRREFPKLKEALIEAYAFERGWSKSDEEILPSLMTARSLAMLGWLNSRSDHPVLRRRVKVAAARTVKHLHKEYGL